MARHMEKPVKKTRLAQMLHNKQIELAESERAIADRFGWSKQALNTWKRGVVPRAQQYADIARFLGVSVEMVAELADEAGRSTGNTKLPDMGAPVRGAGPADAIAMDTFASGYVKPSVGGCFAVKVDGRHVWINPRVKPRAGQSVLVVVDGVGRLVPWVDGDCAGAAVLAELV